MPIPLPHDDPEPNRFSDLDIDDEVAVLAAVHQDLSVGLESAFVPSVDPDAPPLTGFVALGDMTDDEIRDLGIEPGTFGAAHERAQPILDGSQAVVMWRWETQNTGSFFGLSGSNRHVRINGCTVIQPTGEGPTVTRFINWLDVLGQMGVGVAARTMPV